MMFVQGIVRGVWGSVALACSPAASGPDTGTDPDTGAPPTTSSDSSSGAHDTSTTGGVASSSGEIVDGSSGGSILDVAGQPDVGVQPPPLDYDCAALPQGPLRYEFKTGLIAAEDFAFDHLGNFVSSDAGNLVRTPYDGPPELWIAGANATTGIRATSEGVFVFAMQDTLSLVNDDEQPEVVLAGMSYPNAIEVDDAGMVYVAELGGGRVRRIDPQTGEFTIVGEGFTAPNGLSFDTTYRRLYVASNLDGDVDVVEFDDTMTPLGPPTFFAAPGSENLTGVGVDACDNVYVIDQADGAVMRVRPEDGAIDPVIEPGVAVVALGNLGWGSGIGGWDRQTLYVLELTADRLVAVDVGVPEKPRAYP
jgi:hypothetical protein